MNNFIFFNASLTLYSTKFEAHMSTFSGKQQSTRLKDHYIDQSTSKFRHRSIESILYKKICLKSSKFLTNV